MPSRVPALLLIPAALVALTLTGCAAPEAEPESWFTPGAVTPASPTPSAPAAAADAPAPAAPAAPAVAAPPTTIDYVGPVTKRWGGCFGRLGIGDVYYDSTLGVVTAAWKNGVITWSVSDADKAGTPADQGSIDALAGC